MSTPSHRPAPTRRLRTISVTERTRGLVRAAFASVGALALVALAACGAPPARVPALEARAPRAAVPTTTTTEPRSARPARWGLWPRADATLEILISLRTSPGGPRLAANRALTSVAVPGGDGIVSKGRRFVFEGVSARPVPGDEALEGVATVPAPLGGGYAFFGSGNVYYAPTFEAPLRLVGKGVERFTIAPRALFLVKEDDTVALVGLDGATLPGPPGQVESVGVHPQGFMVALAGHPKDDGMTVFFSTDARAWRSLAVTQAPAMSLRDGDVLAIVRRGTTPLFVDAKGHLQKREKHDEDDEGLPLPTKAPSPGALLAEGWLESPIDPDGYFTVRRGHLFVAHERTLRDLGSPFPPELDCKAAATGHVALATCVQLGRTSQIYLLDLARGTATLEREVASAGLVAPQVLPTTPATVLVGASCAGDPRGGFCVRAEDGHYVSIPPPSGPFGSLHLFPGEAFALSPATGRGMDLRDLVRRRDVHYAPEGLATLLAAPSGAPPRPSSSLFARPSPVAVVRTATGLRVLFSPNPLQATGGVPRENVVVDLPLDGRAATTSVVRGTIAAAGARAIRVDGGKLYESVDAWRTWHEAAPPPTGAPGDDEATACTATGCRVGPWARVGWDEPLAAP